MLAAPFYFTLRLTPELKKSFYSCNKNVTTFFKFVLY